MDVSGKVEQNSPPGRKAQRPTDQNRPTVYEEKGRRNGDRPASKVPPTAQDEPGRLLQYTPNNQTSGR